MIDATFGRDYAKGMLHELEEGVDGLEGFLGSVATTGLLNSEENDLMLRIVERAHGFADGFKCCLEMWPAPMKKEAAND